MCVWSKKEDSLRKKSKSFHDFLTIYVLHPFPLYSLFVVFSFLLFKKSKKSLFINKNYERNEFGGSGSSNRHMLERRGTS